MLVGLVGAPNKGKSTIFSALTSVDVGIADYAFTTIKPNLGVAHVNRECAEVSLGVKCSPRNSSCTNGVRHIPINIIDVAGLVPGAHLGKGMGNQFLTDLAGADVLIQVVDASGRTDVEGRACAGCDPSEEALMLRDEMAEWLADIILRHKATLSKRADGDAAICELLSGFRIDAKGVRRAAEESYLTLSSANWDRDAAKKFSSSLLKANKPIVIAANKADQADNDAIDAISEKLNGTRVVKCSAAIELALVKAANKGIVDYTPGAVDFGIIKEVSPEQKSALDYMHEYVAKNKGTGVQDLLSSAVFGATGNIVVYPVEDESHYADRSGNVLPDAILMRKGSTAYDLAGRIHSDIAKGMKYAVDARSKMRVQKEYMLQDGDIIKIVSTAR